MISLCLPRTLSPWPMERNIFSFQNRKFLKEKAEYSMHVFLKADSILWESMPHALRLLKFLSNLFPVPSFISLKALLRIMPFFSPRVQPSLLICYQSNCLALYGFLSLTDPLSLSLYISLHLSFSLFFLSFYLFLNILPLPFYLPISLYDYIYIRLNNNGRP